MNDQPVRDYLFTLGFVRLLGDMNESNGPDECETWVNWNRKTAITWAPGQDYTLNAGAPLSQAEDEHLTKLIIDAFEPTDSE
jgi:hypothetical protein